MSYDLNNLPAILNAAIEAARSAKITQLSGCGRVYVVLPEKIRKGSKINKVFEAAGLKLFNRPYCTGLYNVYVGYQNCTGYEADRAEIISKVLNENGIKSYVDYDAD